MTILGFIFTLIIVTLIVGGIWYSCKLDSAVPIFVGVFCAIIFLLCTGHISKPLVVDEIIPIKIEKTSLFTSIVLPDGQYIITDSLRVHSETNTDRIRVIRTIDTSVYGLVNSDTTNIVVK